MASTYDPTVLWFIVAAIAAGTFLIRVSFVHLFGQLEQVPPRVNQALRFVPAAVLTALFVPAFVSLDAGLIPMADPSRLAAGLVGGIVAWRTESLIWTLASGMGVLWFLTLVV